MTDNLQPMAVSAAQAANLLGISKPKVYELMGKSDFPSFKLGGRTLISVDGLREWIAKQTERGDMRGT